MENFKYNNKSFIMPMSAYVHQSKIRFVIENLMILWYS